MTPLAILTAILNSVWQAAAFAALVWLTLRWVGTGRLNAATRGVIWWAVLAMLFILPFAPRLSMPTHGTPPAPTVSQWGEAVAAPSLNMLPSDPGEPHAILTLPEKPEAKWPLAILALWGAIFLWRLAVIARSYLYLRGVKRNAALSDVRLPDVGRRARLLLSRDIASPMAVGFLRPAIILPEDLTEHITSDELDQILLHESAHLARRDDWSNLLFRLLGAVLALHPIAWWILRQIEYEREAACDDWVVARTGAARPYAGALAHMVELRWEHGDSRPMEALASGVFGRRSRIGDRIEALLRQGRQFSPRVSMTRVAAGFFALCCLAAAGSFAPRWIAFAKIPLALTHETPPPVQKISEPQPQLIVQAEAKTPARPAPAPVKAPDPAFEVASIRPATFSSPAYAAGYYAATASNPSCFARKVSISGTLVSLPQSGICELIAFAYGIEGYQIVGAPSLSLPPVSNVEESVARADSLPAFFYDIEARAPGPDAPTEGQVQAMVRTLLADRFRLQVHHATRDMSYYALVVGKHGTKLTPSKEDCQRAASGDKPDVTLHVCKRSIEDLIHSLNASAGRPVVDETGLTGTFDYDIHSFNTADAISVYEKYLGLSLESRKGPIDVVVIDHVEKPSAN